MTKAGRDWCKLPLKDTKEDGDALYSQKVAFQAKAYFAKQQWKHFLHISRSHDMAWYVWVEESEIFLLIKEGKKERESADSLMTASGVVAVEINLSCITKTIASVLCKSGMEIRPLSSILDVSRNK